MMSTTPISYQEVFHIVEQLSAEDQFKLTTYLIQQAPWAKKSTSRLSHEERRVHIRALQGKYAHILTSSEEFARQKQDEIDQEESVQ